MAQAHGHEPSVPVIGAPDVFLFEPHQPEQCEWKPQILLDITSVWEKKYAAFKVMAAQEHLWAILRACGVAEGSAGRAQFESQRDEVRRGVSARVSRW